MIRMHDSPHKLNRGARVRLRVEVPSIYSEFAVVGNEGIIGQVRKDRFDLPEIYVQWDRNHWAYNGVQDCWTYPDHFDLVEDNMSQQDKVQQLLTMFAEGLSSVLGEEETVKEEKPEKPRNRFLDAIQPLQQQQDDGEFTQAVDAASAKLGESEAFIIIGMGYQQHSGMPQRMLEPYAIGYSKSPEADLLVTAHMSRVAAKAHENLAMETVASIVQDES